MTPKTKIPEFTLHFNGLWCKEFVSIVVCSLVLEHIENISRIFKLISEHLKINGIVYIGELHPFKQYAGSKASFENEEGKQSVTVFTHHISEFTNSAKENGLTISEIKEYFDDGDNKTSIPRILTLKFMKQSDN